MMMVDVCSDGVVMMVLGKDGYDKVCLASTCWEKPFAGPVGNWWCLSSWRLPSCRCLGGLSVVFRWSLASWWHFGGVSVNFEGVQ